MTGAGKLGATLTAAIVLSLLLVAGCAQKQFVVYDQQIVREIGAQGEPKEPTDVFTPADRGAYLYFKYRDATGSITLRCDISHVAPDGTRTTLSKELVLTPGSEAAYCGVVIDEGKAFPEGKYEAALFHGETPLGSPRAFTVAAGAAPAPTPAASGGTAGGSSGIRRVSAEEKLREEASRHGATVP